MATTTATEVNGAGTTSVPRKHFGVTSKVETISPRMAKELLDTNAHNRRVRKNEVDKYAGAMLRGEWRVNGESIGIDWNGNLVNGQHRLMACVQANVSFQTLIVRGLDPASQLAMDQGIKRTMRDTLAWMGEKDTAQLGSSLRVIHGFLMTGIISTQSRNYAATKDQLIDLLREQPQIRDAQQFPRKGVVARLLTPSVGAALFYIFNEIDAEDAKAFFEQLGSGQGLEEGNPIYTLRRALEENLMRKHSKMDTRHRAALTVKAWNAWRNGEPKHLLRWKPGGNMAEPFPKIDGWDYSSGA